MELKAGGGALDAQARYAIWLAWGTRITLALLAIAFLAYVGGLLAPAVPIERLPALWGQSSAELLRQTGVAPGWDWAERIRSADMLVMAAIALMASCSIPCLAAVVPVFARARERTFAVICLLEIAVLALAASGILAAAH